MLPLVDRPLLAYTFEHLARHGVDRAILSCGYLPTQIEAHFGDRYGPLGLSYRVEPTPLGTGGGIRFGAEGLSETFVALNGDVLHGADLGCDARLPPRAGSRRDDPARARRRPEPVRARPLRRRRQGAGVRREAPRGGDRHEPDQRGPLRPRAGGARPRRPRPAGLDRARRLPEARRGGLALRLSARWLLARHRHAGELSGGALGRAGAELLLRARRLARPRLHARRHRRARGRGRPARPTRLRRQGRR